MNNCSASDSAAHSPAGRLRQPPLVSAVVSTYNAERFLAGCLEDLESQTIADRLEIVVVDSGSQQREGQIVRQFQSRFDNIVYLRTEKRESVYAAWNRGIRAASGIYVTNANSDDRHRRDAFEVLVHALERERSKALAYGDVYITNVPNQTFDTRTVVGEYSWLDFSRINLLRRCEIGPQPLWRRSLHEELGWFDESLSVAGDYEFWLRLAERYEFVHIREKLGLYLAHEQSIEHSNPEQTYEETQHVRQKYIRRFIADPSFTHEKELQILHEHKTALSALLAKFKTARAAIPLHEVELHFAAMVLMLWRQGKLRQARELCDRFFLTFGESSRLVTFYRMLLLEPAPAVSLEPTAPLVSVVIPLYNQGRFLPAAVASVVNQSYGRWECVIVDDGSTDNSYQIALEIQRRYGNKPIRLLHHSNQGKGYTRNRGVRETRGEFVCVLDADDMIASTYFEIAVSLLRADGTIGWVTPKTLQFGRRNRIFYHFPFDFIMSLLVCPSPVSAVFRRSMWEKLGGYREDMTDREDWEFWIRAGEHGWQAATTSTVEFLYRIQFHRTGEQPEINFRSKDEIVKAHPWWYRPMGEKEQKELFLASVAGSFPESILRGEAVRMMRQCAPQQEARRQMVERIKQLYEQSKGEQPA